MHASIVIAINFKEAADKALNKRLLIAGIPVKTAIFEPKNDSEQCLKCQQVGHATKDCKNSASCQLCGQNHPTRLHTCKICEIVGDSCIHTILKCSNCGENHAANSKECNLIQNAKERLNAIFASNAKNLNANSSPVLNVNSSPILIPSSALNSNSNIQNMELEY
jgi:hypothetical protein